MAFSLKNNPRLFILLYALVSTMTAMRPPTAPKNGIFEERIITDPMPPVPPSALNETIAPPGSVELTSVLTEEVWNVLFPEMVKNNCDTTTYYKREAFIKAADLYRKKVF